MMIHVSERTIWKILRIKKQSAIFTFLNATCQGFTNFNFISAFIAVADINCF